MYVLIGVLMLMLVVNWTYLVLASRHTSRLSDVLAYSAVTELLDDAWLQNHANFGSATQADDIAAANNAVTNVGTGFLKRNNDVAGAALRASAANPGEVTITAARVPTPSQVASGGNFVTAPAASEPYNTLRVEILRDPAGPNPVLFMMRGFGSPNAAKITGAATVTLDARLVGFRPDSTFKAPVAPLSLQQSDWFTARQAQALNGSTDTNGNGIREFDFVIKLNGNGNANGNGNGNNANSNAVLVSLNATQNIDIVGTTLSREIIEGEISSDFAGGFLGPVAPLGSAKPYTTGTILQLDSARSNDLAGLNEAALLNAFNTVASSNYPRRVFPVHNNYADPITIVGFVGARVLSATFQAGSGQGNNGNRIVVRLEPDFIIHATAETRQTQSGNTVPENIYINKTRLTR